MRRLWSYIILTGASLLLMGSTFNNVFKQSTSNIEYSDGKEMVFRISEKDDAELEEVREDGKTPAEVISQNMIERLDTLKLTNYVVSTEGYDTVKVTLNQDNDSNYNNVKNLMTFNGSLALSSKLDDFLVNSNEEEKFLDGKAYMETKDNYPTINIPVSGAFSNLLEIVKGYADEKKTDAAESQEAAEEGGDATYTYNLYLWHDYAEGDTFAKTDSSNTEEYDPHVAEKRFMQFNIDDIKEDDNKLTAYVNIQDANGNQKYEAKEVKKSFDIARYYVALINSGALDYKVTFIYENNVDAITENLVSTEGYILWSYTLRATLVCILIIALFLFIFFRLGTLSVMTLSLGSVFAGVGSIILFTAEFNAAGLIALCAVAITSLFSGVIYLTKLKEEAYRGRSLKKANSEASKKSLLPIIDFNVVLIIFGVFAYVFGAPLMRSFSIIAVIGGLASLILNTVGLKGLMWLATNTTKLQGKYEVFGIDAEKVPNVLKEEKQTYFGSYADKDFTKKKLPIGIIASVLFVAGLTGMIVFGSINKGVVYNGGGSTQNSEIFVETTTKNTLITEDAVKAVLANVYTYGKDVKKAKSLESQVDEIIYKTREDTGEDKNDIINYTYYVIKLNTTLDNGEASNAYYVEKDADGNETMDRVYSKDTEGNISGLLTARLRMDPNDNNNELDSAVTVDIKTVKTMTAQQPEFAPVIWGTLVSIAVSAFYLLIRYRLSRGLAAFVVPTLITGGIAGFFALTRLPVTSYAVVVVPVIALMCLFNIIVIANRERELVLEDKAHDNSVENRKAIMVRANSIAFANVLFMSAVNLYMFINFFGFGAKGNIWLFLILGVSVFVIHLFVTTLYGPISHFFYKLFSRVNIEKFTSKFKRKKKKVVAKQHRSAEPEERTFIGIND